MKFNYLNQLLSNLKSYFLRPKYYGVDIIFESYCEQLNSYFKFEKITHYIYLSYALKKIPLKENPEFLVPFKIKKNKKYYLLIVYYTSIENMQVKENLQHIIELFDNVEQAQNAINYIEDKIKPTQHDIFKMAENPNLSEKLNLEDYSFSIDSKGELTLIENTKWRGSLKVGSKFVIQEVKLLSNN